MTAEIPSGGEGQITSSPSEQQTIPGTQRQDQLPENNAPDIASDVADEKPPKTQSATMPDYSIHFAGPRRNRKGKPRIGF